MLRQDSPPTATDRDGHSPNSSDGAGNVDIQEELNNLEEMILVSFRIPLTGKTIVDEEQLLDQLDLVRLNLPSAFQKAQEVLRQRDQIITEAEDYAQQIAMMAEQRAAQIMDEVGIVRQAEAEAQRIRHQVQQECEALEEQTLMEIEQRRQRANQELEEVRHRALNEQQSIQQGADDYADGVLDDLEQRLSQMLRIVRNGRQQLQDDPPPPVPEATTKDSLPSAKPPQKPTSHRRRNPNRKN